MKLEPCEFCRGTGEEYAGYEDVFHRCTWCNGIGSVPSRDELGRFQKDAQDIFETEVGYTRGLSKGVLK